MPDYTAKQYADLIGVSKEHILKRIGGASNGQGGFQKLPSGVTASKRDGMWIISTDFEPTPRTVTIYFVRETLGSDLSVKIGYATDVSSRVRNIASGNWRKPELVASFVGTHADEQYLHKLFAHLRINNSEWFAPAPELLEYIDHIRRGITDD